MVTALKTEDSSDSYADLSNLVKELYGKLDPAIRNHLLKRGISVVQNSYAGFDSEYKNIDVKRNKLLTVQLAVNSKTYVKVPKLADFTLSSVNPLTREVYTAAEIPGFDTLYLQSILDNLIKRVRLLRYPYYDESVMKLVAGLQKVGAPFMEKEDMYVFALPLSDIQPILFIAEGGEISFTDLVKKTNEISTPELERTFHRVLALIRGI